MKEKLKIMFAGSPQFAVPSLNKLLEDGRFEILGVITQPDKASGRGNEMKATPVKEFALKNNLKVLQPLKIKDELELISKNKLDFLVVVAYGKLIPKSVLDLPKYGCINLHGSLLPRYRGAAVIQAPLLNGDDRTGATIMLMDEGLDTGPIIKTIEIALKGEETAQDVHDKLSILGAENLPQVLIDFSLGKIKAKKQEGESFYAKEIKKEDGRIDWSKSAVEIEKMVRAYAPWPGSFSQLPVSNSKLVKNIKILSVEKEVLTINKYKIGETFLYNNKLAVQCSHDALIIEKLQMEGGKALPAKDFLLGHKELLGSIFK